MELAYLHRLASPREGEEKELLVLLHGYGSNKEDLFSFADEIPPRYEVVSFDAPFKTPYGGKAWYDINLLNAQKFNDVEQAKKSMEYILENIQIHAKKWNCPENKVNLGGFSQGGILTYALAFKKAEIFNRMLCLSAYPALDVIGEISSDRDYSFLEFFISHGKEDAVIPIEWARQGPVLLDEYSIPYDYHEYNSGHGINADNFRDLILFLMR